MRSVLLLASLLFVSNSAFATLTCVLFSDGAMVTQTTEADTLVLELENSVCAADVSSEGLSISLAVNSYEKTVSSPIRSLSVDNDDSQCACEASLK